MTPATIAADRLKSFVQRVEKLDEERRALGGDIRDVLAEAKGAGFDVKTIRRIVMARRMDAAERDEQAMMFDLYAQQLGMGEAAGAVGLIGGSNDGVDERAILATELLAQGKSIRAVATETGMGHGSVQRLKAALAAGVPQDRGTADGTPVGTPPSTAAGDAAAEASPAAVAAPAPVAVETEAPDVEMIIELDGREIMRGPSEEVMPKVIAAMEATAPPEYRPRVAPLAVVKAPEMPPIPTFLRRGVRL